MSLRRTGIRRTGGPRRHQRLRQRSRKRESEQRERRKQALAAFGYNPACAIGWDDRCRGWADAPHELRKASQGGSRTGTTNMVPACHPCNEAVEDNPAEAHARGLVTRREDT